MTTINNLIDQVGGIEKAREIVAGAPNGALTYNTTVKRYSEGWIKTFGNVVINDLRTAIEHHYYGRSEAEELAAYAELSHEKIEGGAMLVGDFSDARKKVDQLLGNSEEFEVGDLVVKTHPKNTILWPVLGVYKNGGVWLDYKGFCWKPPRVRHATPAEIKAGCRLNHSENVTDMVTDIRNHISPNTKVINHG